MWLVYTCLFVCWGCAKFISLSAGGGTVLFLSLCLLGCDTFISLSAGVWLFYSSLSAGVWHAYIFVCCRCDYYIPVSLSAGVWQVYPFVCSGCDYFIPASLSAGGSPQSRLLIYTCFLVCYQRRPTLKFNRLWYIYIHVLLLWMCNVINIVVLGFKCCLHKPQPFHKDVFTEMICDLLSRLSFYKGKTIYPTYPFDDHVKQKYWCPLYWPICQILEFFFLYWCSLLFFKDHDNKIFVLCYKIV